MIESANTFGVGMQRDRVVVLNAPPTLMTKHEALNLAAWLVALADDRFEFAALLETVLSGGSAPSSGEPIPGPEVS